MTVTRSGTRRSLAAALALLVVSVFAVPATASAAPVGRPTPTPAAVVGHVSTFRMSNPADLRLVLWRIDLAGGPAVFVAETGLTSSKDYRFSDVADGWYQVKVHHAGLPVYLSDTFAVRGSTRTIDVRLPGLDRESRESDMSGDGRPDVVARDSGGRLWVYTGDGKGNFTGKYVLATGWQSINLIVRAGDWDRDGDGDLIARDTSGVLWLYPGDGGDGLEPRVQLATGWGSHRTISGLRDYNNDGWNDLIVIERAQRSMKIFPGDGLDGLEEGWDAASYWEDPPQLVVDAIGVGDLEGIGDGYLMKNKVTIHVGWPRYGDVYYYRWRFFTSGAAGKTFLYWQDDAMGLQPDNWASKFRTLAGAGDFNGDFKNDLLGVDSAGRLWFIPSKGSGKYGSRVLLKGSGWTYMLLAR